MDSLSVSTVVYLPPAEVFDFVVSFPRYADYSKYLTDVRQAGEGGAGTRYRLQFAWWKLTFTAHSEVTSVERPTRVDWRLTRHLDADGRWRIEPLESLPAGAPDDADTASRVYFEVAYDPGSVAGGALDLPRFVSLDWVIDRVQPLVVEEAERVVERVVADLEGRRRPVDLTVHERPGADERDGERGRGWKG